MAFGYDIPAPTHRLAIDLQLQLQHCYYRHGLVLMELPATGCGAAGVCSTAYTTVNVYTVNDILSRRATPNTTTVMLVLQNDLLLTTTLLLDAAFSCTILLSAQAPGYTIAASFDNKPAVSIQAVTNLISMGVHYSIPVTTSSKKTCTADPITGTGLCPAVFVNLCSAVQIVQASIFGRIDVYRTDNSLFDSLMSSSIVQDAANFRFGRCGYNTLRAKSNNVVSNCDISGSAIGVLIAQGSVGISVLNNYMHNLNWAGVQIGQGIHTTGDGAWPDCLLSLYLSSIAAPPPAVLRLRPIAIYLTLDVDLLLCATGMLCTVSNNYILRRPTDTFNQDSGGIYTATHWVNPGNYMSCNYIIGYEHCYYLDLASSGITIDGAVCVNNQQGGLKQNNGQFNKITSMLSISPYLGGGYITCQLWDVNNCLGDPGSFWADRLDVQYSTAPGFMDVSIAPLTLSFQFLYTSHCTWLVHGTCGTVLHTLTPAFPFLDDFCGRTEYQGVQCNPDGQPTAAQTGNCSGLPTGNVWQVAVVAGAQPNVPHMRSCDGFTNINDLNSIEYKLYNGKNPVLADPGFLDVYSGDYGLRPDSKVLTDLPGFKSCPRDLTGPKRVDLDSYFTTFGAPVERPPWKP
eukprot:SM000241S08519  [mRNA]  locus=s241:82315:84440:- [translate_table: standard]